MAEGWLAASLSSSQVGSVYPWAAESLAAGGWLRSYPPRWKSSYATAPRS